MQTYTVIKTFRGSPNGKSVALFEAGSEVDSEQLGEDLEQVALDNEWIKKARAPRRKQAPLPAQNNADGNSKPGDDAGRDAAGNQQDNNAA